MKRRAVLLIIVLICLLSTAGYGQDLPSAEILTADVALITYSSGEPEIQSGEVTFLY